MERQSVVEAILGFLTLHSAVTPAGHLQSVTESREREGRGLRGSAEVAVLDPALEGWENARALQGG